MNAVMQSSAHPLVVLEQNRLITQALLDRLSAYGGSIFLVTGLHRCAVALGAQRRTPVLVLAGKPPESRWTDWRAQVKSATHTSCPMMAVDLPKESAAPSFLTFQGIQGAVDLGDASVDVLRHIQALIERIGMTTLAYGPLHLDRTKKILNAAGRSVALKDALFDLLLLFWGHPQRILPMELLQKVLASAGSTLAMEACSAIHKLRSCLHYLGFDDCIVTLRGRGYQFIPPSVSPQDRRMAARPTGRNPLFTNQQFSERRFGAASF
ncbi:helix-turn-helix domain-containing protein [Acidithiobacillus ferrooxidans]|uniref:helix-turn-helix domain-containing protein n=1 Tax=Acidithiobacillus ferrooxidans TaxID=920 RepID=UPI00214C6B37|nr:helix-turn-helix domain-containing protein [Acidithiobacillus ferrooxidans]MCR2831674.1 helix-turn-helix domain-containing protein [Acidithiobacillus ferrooxidans]